MSKTRSWMMLQCSAAEQHCRMGMKKLALKYKHKQSYTAQGRSILNSDYQRQVLDKFSCYKNNKKSSASLNITYFFRDRFPKVYLVHLVQQPSKNNLLYIQHGKI